MSMRFVALSVVAGFVGTVGCASHAAETASSSSADTASDNGTFDFIVVPPAQDLDWSSPNALAQSAIISEGYAKLQEWSTQVVHAHPVGHVHVRMSCGDVNIPLTGQTGAGSDFTGALDGLGSMFHTFPGRLDDTDEVRPDVERRFQTGQIKMLSFKITKDTCKHLRGFFDEYVNTGAVKNYGGQYRPRRMEGGGCTAFGSAFLDVGGLLPRSQYTPIWARSLKIGVGRISDVFGDGAYRYGSLLTTRNDDGTLSTWPKGQPIKVQQSAIRPVGSPWLNAWAGDGDHEYNADPDHQPDVVPTTLLDPQLMAHYIEGVFANGGGAALGRTWTAKTVGQAQVLETDATDARVKPYMDTEEDLYKD